MKIKYLPAIIVAIVLLSFMSCFGQSVVNTLHNLSVSGPGNVKAESETQICIFCHTPHKSSPRKPLWNREDPGLTYDLYGSSTIQGSPEQPDGTSILCLSCHDGTIGLGTVISRENAIAMQGGLTMMPDGRSDLETSLQDDHPVSFIYNAALAASDGELSDPSELSPVIALQDEKVQCTSCHDPHTDSYGKFLVTSIRYSELCIYCHIKEGWSQSSHNISSAAWNGSGDNPWFHTPYATVSENACENCHDPHSAEGGLRILNYYAEENNCLNCHNGNVAEHNIQQDLLKPYRHDVFQYTGIHDPEEETIIQTRHVECADCHSPHFSNSTSAEPPAVSGALEGSRGADTNGNPIEMAAYEYEICYRCHSDNLDKPGSVTSRQIEQDNVRLEFNPSNPSFHPVEAAGRNANVPSLVSPLTESSMIYCSDCHAGDNSSAAGPHGSNWPQILKFRYERADYTVESYDNFELCYQCHERSSIINSGGSFGEEVHRKHIVEENTPCNICHDPHGISSEQGTFSNNTHLINFDISVVQPSQGAMGRLEFIDDGEYSGRCYLYCHQRNHNPREY